MRYSIWLIQVGIYIFILIILARIYCVVKSSKVTVNNTLTLTRKSNNSKQNTVLETDFYKCNINLKKHVSTLQVWTITIHVCTITYMNSQSRSVHNVESRGVPTTCHYAISAPLEFLSRHLWHFLWDLFS